MPSTDRRLELKAKDIGGSDRLTAGCVCQWVKLFLSHYVLAEKKTSKLWQNMIYVKRPYFNRK